jgi:hypothetical protein
LLVVVALVVVVVAVMVLTALVVPAVAVVVVFMIPVSFVQLPALLVMIVVRVAPIGAFVRRTVPAALDPAVVATVGGPISFNPSVAWTGNWSALFVAEGRGSGSDVYRNLG